MKILYLCLKSTFENKMSRVRFDSMKAIAKISDVVYSGNGWDNYNSNLSVNDNIKILYGDSKPDIVVAYKPDNFKGFAEIAIPKCIRYNEMWPVDEWTKELSVNKIDLCIAHHLNDIPKYNHVKNVVFKHVPHSAEQTIYQDYGEKKIYDVLFTGATGSHYPFRCRLLNLINKRLKNELNCKILKHPGNNLKNINGVSGKDYAIELNRAKVVITCSSKHFYRLGKYVEIPMSGSVVCGDLPDQDEDEFRKIMLVLERDWDDNRICKEIIDFVKNEEKVKEKTLMGLEWSKNYTQEKYAERFINVVDEFLMGR